VWPAVWAIKFGFPPSLFASTSGVTTAHLAEDLSIHWSGRKVRNRIPRKSPTFFDFQHTSRRKSLQLTCGLPPNRRWKTGSGFGCTPLLKFQHTSAYHQVLRNVENPPRQLENSKKHGFRFSDFLGDQTPWELQYYHCSNFNGFFTAKNPRKTHGMDMGPIGSPSRSSSTPGGFGC